MIVIYTQSGCPKCKVLKTKLEQKNIDYVENTDVEVMLSKGIKSTPCLEIEGKLMEYTEAVKWVNGQ